MSSIEITSDDWISVTLLESSMNLIIKAIKRHYQTTYQKDIVVRRSDFDLLTARWIWPALEKMAADSLLNPVHLVDCNALLRGVVLAQNLPEWRLLVRVAPKVATVELLVRFLSSYDYALKSDGELTPYVRALIARTLNRFLSFYLEAESGDNRFRRLNVIYRSQIKHKSPGRQLISDLASPLGTDTADVLAFPIGAIPHADIPALKKLTKDRLELDLQNISKACEIELKRHETSCSILQELRTRSIEESSEKELRKYCRNYSPRKPGLNQSQIDNLITLHIQVDAGQKERVEEYRDGVLFPLSAQISARARSMLSIDGDIGEFSRAIRVDAFPLMSVFVACALQIQIHTKWNISSVLELTDADFLEDNQTIQIQSIKTRTHDETPISFVMPFDEETRRAIRILRNRLAVLKRNGSVEPSEIRLWLSARRTVGEKLGELAGWPTALRKFTIAHKLPAFSFEQIRVQSLALASLSDGGYNSAVQAAGHSSLKTLSGYIDKLLIQRMNSAINLEFGKRLDESIRYLVNEKELKTQSSNAAPIGDGTSCSNSTSPPNEAWESFGVCNAKNCHSGDGCVNRVLEVNSARIEEVIRTKAFYERNWRRLVNENHAAFQRYHLPAMVFNVAFYGALKRGPYRHLVKQ